MSEPEVKLLLENVLSTAKWYRKNIRSLRGLRVREFIKAIKDKVTML